MAESDLIPAHILSSGARRARETCELVVQALGVEIDIDVTDDLYHASPGSILSLTHQLSDELGMVLLVGHNPTFEVLAELLAGTADESARDTMLRKFPTGALAILDFPVRRWSDLRFGEGHLRGFVRPKDLA
jgi:phosphohistidine phosphatase